MENYTCCDNNKISIVWLSGGPPIIKNDPLRSRESSRAHIPVIMMMKNGEYSDRGVSHSLEISGNPYTKSEILYG